MIRETIVTTQDTSGRVHISPLGVSFVRGPLGVEQPVLQPFKPSATLDNVLATGCAVINYTGNVKIIAGCLTGRREWPLVAANKIAGARLADTLAHAELSLARVEDDALRPRLLMSVVHEASHAPFRGFNRAQGAVIEAAILVSRLHMLPPEKIDREIDYLKIAIDKTAGPDEREAWEWLVARIAEFRAGEAAT